ncbi:MAG: T9SS type A sorting domain-containing protein [Bacteroidia bacterium]|nr:T9SS type A sorting domain-containing protein [Bacteroidia bacterium]
MNLTIKNTSNQLFNCKLIIMFLSAFLFTNYAIGQDFIIHDNSLLIPDSPTPFLQSNPYPTSLFTSSKLELIFASGQIKDSKIINTQNEILNQLPLLFQNHPNPFNEKTLIDYFIPETTSNAFLKVTDINGKIVKVFQISKSGFGQMELDCSNLAIGKYFYSLIVNTQVVDTKAMFIKRID